MRRNKFSLSHFRLFSCDMGKLIPVGLWEVLPGDTFQHSTSVLVRCSPLLAPVMHPVDVRLHHWFVPHRLSWDNWENFITGGPDGLNNSVAPLMSVSGNNIGGLFDYLGIPNGITPTQNVSALPVRGYQRIWNEWYRDQDLETAAPIATTDGVDGTTSLTLQACAWEKDYFTSARPWEQKGPQVNLPIGGTAPVRLVGGGPWTGDLVKNAATGGVVGVGNVEVGGVTGQLGWRDTFTGTGGNVANVVIDPQGSLEADLSSATAVSVNQLRQALALQRYEEARARYGSRYVEYLRYLGVRSSDARLQRPEYLGGGRQTIQFSEVLQTGPGAQAGSVVGNLAGHGIAASRSNRYRRFFEEHGYVFTLMSVRPKTIYMNGIPRHWSRTSKNDYWQREFQHIGQQAISNREIFANHSVPTGTWGYQDRYDEYRRQESSVAGEFRTLLNFWHFARDFATPPALNASFVSCVPTERTFAVNTNHVLWCMAKHSVQARRLVSREGTSMTF